LCNHICCIYQISCSRFILLFIFYQNCSKLIFLSLFIFLLSSFFSSHIAIYSCIIITLVSFSVFSSSFLILLILAKVAIYINKSKSRVAIMARWLVRHEVVKGLFLHDIAGRWPQEWLKMILVEIVINAITSDMCIRWVLNTYSDKEEFWNLSMKSSLHKRVLSKIYYVVKYINVLKKDNFSM